MEEVGCLQTNEQNGYARRLFTVFPAAGAVCLSTVLALRLDGDPTLGSPPVLRWRLTDDEERIKE